MPIHYLGTLCQFLYVIKQLKLTQWATVTEHGLKVGQRPSFGKKKDANPNLRHILLWKRHQAAQPAPQKVQGTSKVIKSLWTHCKLLLLGKGVLYSQWQTEDGRGTRFQLVLPCSLVPDILSALHDAHQLDTMV